LPGAASAPILGSHLANDAGASTASQSGEVQGSIHPANAAALALIRLTNAAAQLVLRTQVRRKES